MSVMSMRLPDEAMDRLGDLAKATGRTKSFLAGQAIMEFLERESWQVNEISQALGEADAGDFASDQEIEAMHDKWGGNAR
ncbi:CopG family ribbon-helix-helix protein [Desulfomicrobium escambiense]|uniref:CopG family ribbon-helix-helix protein n=1 Tax=Desulfomicrobium escambiense TaxID=29503 RepID=UPI00040BF30B|nr:CopG family ribbon-helix-helix protein [Desulfomicrobium escambiense]